MNWYKRAQNLQDIEFSLSDEFSALEEFLHRFSLKPVENDQWVVTYTDLDGIEHDIVKPESTPEQALALAKLRIPMMEYALKTAKLSDDIFLK